MEYIRKLDASGKARPCFLFFVTHVILALISLNVRIATTRILFHTHVIQDSLMPVVLNMPNSLQPRPLLFVLIALIDTLYLLFPKNLETGSDRIVLDSIYCLLLQETPFPFSPINLLPINSKRKKLSDTHYIFKDIPVRNEFGMIATIHTFGRDLKWNPHIHCLIPELIYSFKKDKIKTFHHFNFTKLRKTFQFEFIRLIQEAGGLKKTEEKNRIYKDHPKGFYVYAKFKSNDNDSNDASSNKNSKDIQGCVNYFIRYAGRPAMAENRITEYNKESKTVSWFYNDHKDEKRHDVTDNVIDFINCLIRHIPDYHFLTTRYYGFYANASKKTLDKVHVLLGIKKNKDYSREKRTKALKNKLNKLKYRTHLIDSFNLRSNSMQM